MEVRSFTSWKSGQGHGCVRKGQEVIKIKTVKPGQGGSRRIKKGQEGSMRVGQGQGRSRRNKKG